MEPTEAARAIRLDAIRKRATDERNTSSAALDRRWLLGEVDRLTAERDTAVERLNDMLLDHHEKDAP